MVTGNYCVTSIGLRTGREDGAPFCCACLEHMCAHKHTHIYINTYTHTYIYTYMHTYINIYIYTVKPA